jgi:hypothetical protein
MTLLQYLQGIGFGKRTGFIPQAASYDGVLPTA